MKDLINAMVKKIHDDNFKAGWYTNLKFDKYVNNVVYKCNVDVDTAIILLSDLGIKKHHGHNVPEKLALIHSEVSEALEGYRKNLLDDHLQHRKMFEVELADVIIRVFDLAGAEGLDLGGAIEEKLEYNKKREDHKLTNRMKENGKAF